MNRLLTILNAIASSPQAAAVLKLLGEMSPNAAFALLSIGVCLHGAAAIVRINRPRLEVRLSADELRRVNDGQPVVVITTRIAAPIAKPVEEAK